MSGISTSKKLLKSVAVDAKIPTMMIGDPGVGKSASVRALADELDCDVIVLLGSQLDQTDLTGLPQGRELGKRSEERRVGQEGGWRRGGGRQPRVRGGRET